MAPDATPIGELEDGRVATVRGRVRRAIRAIEGPDGVDCVYYDRGDAEEEARPDLEAFWLEDDTGRVLIPAEFRVQGGDLTQQDHIDVIDADVQQVSARLTDLKREVRDAQTRDIQRFRKLRVEQDALKELATLLCCIRAQANGNVHGGKGTLESQAELIRTRGEALHAEGHALRSIELALSIRQQVIAIGDEVVVEAAFREAPMPAGLGAMGGYRDRPTCLQARARAVGKPIQVTATTESHAAAVMEERARAEARANPKPRPPAPSGRSVSQPTSGASPAQIAGAVLLAAMVGFYLYLIM